MRGAIVIGGKKYVNKDGLAALIKVRPHSVECMYSNRKGPPSVKIGRCRYYPLDRVEKWVVDRIVDHGA